MLPLLVAVALAALAVAATLGGLGVGVPAAWTHGALAVGVLSLILGAMGYFVPVLTRSGGAPRSVRLMPMLALGSGVVVVLALAGLFPRNLGIGMAVTAAIAAAVTTLAWTLDRGRAALGPPHPGLGWYVAACGFLVAGLLAALAMVLWPQHHLPLRLLHLHFNTLGFVGLTAIGTLQVLMPTAAGCSDPGAGTRLKRDLPWAASATALVAVGAAWAPPLAFVGLILYLLPVLRLGRAWWSALRASILQPHGAAPSLGLALLGLLCLLVAGGAHGLGWLSGRDAILAFIATFLLPLVSGAATQLLPIWLRPGSQTDWHHDFRRRLGRWSAARAGLMVAGGILIAFGVAAGAWIAAAGCALLLAAAAGALSAALAHRPPKIEKRP